MASNAPAIVPVEPDRPLADEPLRLALDALRAGRLIVIPTETVYGLAADPRARGAVERIYHGKARAADKPITFLGADAAQFECLGIRLSAVAAGLAARFWPGPLTLVVPSPDGWSGLRVPAHPVALSLLRAAAWPLAVTSANRSGEPPACSAREAAEALGGAVELVLDAGRAPGGRASTVARLDGTRLEILREGALSPAELEDAIAGGGVPPSAPQGRSRSP